MDADISRIIRVQLPRIKVRRRSEKRWIDELDARASRQLFNTGWTCTTLAYFVKLINSFNVSLVLVIWMLVLDTMPIRKKLMIVLLKREFCGAN